MSSQEAPRRSDAVPPTGGRFSRDGGASDNSAVLEAIARLEAGDVDAVVLSSRQLGSIAVCSPVKGSSREAKWIARLGVTRNGQAIRFRSDVMGLPLVIVHEAVATASRDSQGGELRSGDAEMVAIVLRPLEAAG